MGRLKRLSAISSNAIASWGPRAYQDDIIEDRFFHRASYILNAPDAIRHVLIDNYDNYARTPAGIRVLRPMLGQGLLLAEGRACKHQRRTLAPAFTPRAVATLVPHMLSATDETVAALDVARGGAPSALPSARRAAISVAMKRVQRRRNSAREKSFGVGQDNGSSRSSSEGCASLMP
jgi:cytochrome P450